MSQLDSFNWISGSYDRLVKIIFGDSLNKAQRFYLKDIPAQANVLVLGAGTGLFLGELARINPSCRVWYIEASSGMIKRAKKNVRSIHHQPQVYFIHGTENSIPDEIKFDAVITNFFLDLFCPSTLENVIQKIKSSLKDGGIWFVSDFITQNRYWQRILLKIMYLFFKNTCGIESGKLPPWELKLKNADLIELKSETFFYAFIKSAVFTLEKPSE